MNDTDYQTRINYHLRRIEMLTRWSWVCLGVVIGSVLVLLVTTYLRFVS